MSESNQRTLQTYDAGIQEYIDGTPQTTNGFQKEWIDSVFESISNDAAILEIGSAFGRDATYLKKLGYSPQLSDASISFVEYLNNHGFEAFVLNIVNEQPNKKYDVILACAVFLHFTKEDFKKALLNVKKALNTNGKFALSLKVGEGEKWSDEKMNAPRYFHYWNEESLRPLVEDIGMKISRCYVNEDKWLLVTLENDDD